MLFTSNSAAMQRYLGTGSVWKDPDFSCTGRFLCNYSQWRLEGTRFVQYIFFAWSQDLLHWYKLAEENPFAPDELFYKRSDVDARWDCIWTVNRPEGDLYGYWTATPEVGAVGVFAGRYYAISYGEISGSPSTTYFAPLKKAVLVDGALYLAWRPGNDRFREHEIRLEKYNAGLVCFNPERGLLLEGNLRLPASLHIDTAGEQAGRKSGVEIRLLLRAKMLELYLDDYFIQPYSMVKAPLGSISVENAEALRLWEWG